MAGEAKPPVKKEIETHAATSLMRWEIISRGIDRRNIFRDDNDRNRLSCHLQNYARPPLIQSPSLNLSGTIADGFPSR